MKIGVLTGGGDCPGWMRYSRGCSKINQNGHEIIGIKEGWRGLLESKFIKLDLESVSGILPRGGTILRSSRTNVYKMKVEKHR